MKRFFVLMKFVWSNFKLTFIKKFLSKDIKQHASRIFQEMNNKSLEKKKDFGDSADIIRNFFLIANNLSIDFLNKSELIPF